MLNRPRVLVANPDPGICLLLRRHFSSEGYSVITVELGQTMLEQLRRTAPNVIILSAALDDLASGALISRMHTITSAKLLVLLSTESKLTAKEILDAGADDCLPEPFLLEELAARTRRLLHRVGTWLGPRVVMTSLGKLEINALERSVRLDGKPVELTSKEFDLLAVLVAANGAMLNHDMLLRQVWGDGDRAERERQKLRRIVISLRRKIEPNPAQPALLVSIRGGGYRLNRAVEGEPKEWTPR